MINKKGNTHVRNLHILLGVIWFILILSTGYITQYFSLLNNTTIKNIIIIIILLPPILLSIMGFAVTIKPPSRIKGCFGWIHLKQKIMTEKEVERINKIIHSTMRPLAITILIAAPAASTLLFHYISTYAPYLIMGFFGIVILAQFIEPENYMKKMESREFALRLKHIQEIKEEENG